jgi:hypothetical protein
MHFRAQLDRSLATLSARGLARRHAAPLLFRLLWTCGVRVRPPHFLGFAQIATVYGSWFACAWGLFMWVLVWSPQGLDWLAVLLRAGGAGAAFGLTMAWFYTRERREFKLPAWESFGRDEQTG